MDEVENRLGIELQDLKSRYGVGLDSLLPSEVLQLVRACEAVENPFGKNNLELLDIPVRLSCGIELHRLTIGAEIWIEEFASKWWGNNEKLLSFAMVYAMVHAKDKADFPYNREEALNKISELVNRLKVTNEELEKAMALLLPEKQEGEEGEEGKSADIAEIIDTLEVETGIKADAWLWGKSLKRTINCYLKCMRLIALKAGGTTERMKDDLDLALTKLAKIKKAIYKRLNSNE